MADQQQEERYARFTRPGEEEPDLGVFMDAVVEDGKGWLEAQKNYGILFGSEKLGKLSGTLLVAVVSALFIGAVLVMSSVALAIWLGRIMGDLALGFLAVAGIYLLLTVIFYFIWRHILRDRITLAIINAAYEKD
ncbi:MAG: phage holin family protein [Flavobacteriales bacterium]|nr:phage holin family protein [Flavobacteriales bacterium]